MIDLSLNIMPRSDFERFGAKLMYGYLSYIRGAFLSFIRLNYSYYIQKSYC